MVNTISRRDQVNKFKSIFAIFKFSLMGICSILATLYLVYIQYANPLIEKGRPHSIEGFMVYLENPANVLLTVSYGLCSIIAVCFVVFLIMHGIQTLVVKFMMRNSG